MDNPSIKIKETFSKVHWSDTNCRDQDSIDDDFDFEPNGFSVENYRSWD